MRGDGYQPPTCRTQPVSLHPEGEETENVRTALDDDLKIKKPKNMIMETTAGADLLMGTAGGAEGGKKVSGVEGGGASRENGWVSGNLPDFFCLLYPSMINGQMNQCN